jgi:hypothetical protein
MYLNIDKYLWNLLVKFQLNPTVEFEVMLNHVKLDGKTFYTKIRIWLTRVVSQGWTISFPPSSRRFALESWIGLVATSLAFCLSLQNSLIANIFLQQHYMEVVSKKTKKPI